MMMSPLVPLPALQRLPLATLVGLGRMLRQFIVIVYVYLTASCPEAVQPKPRLTDSLS